MPITQSDHDEARSQEKQMLELRKRQLELQSRRGELTAAEEAELKRVKATAKLVSETLWYYYERVVSDYEQRGVAPEVVALWRDRS